MIIPKEIWQGLPPALAIREQYRGQAAPQVVSWYRRVGFARLIADLPPAFQGAEAVTIQGARETVTFTAADEPVVVGVPGVVAQAWNLAGAVPGMALRGVVSREQAAARVAVCGGCPLLGAEGEWVGRCRECGCPVAQKAMWASERCPQGKWPEP